VNGLVLPGLVMVLAILFAAVVVTTRLPRAGMLMSALASALALLLGLLHALGGADAVRLALPLGMPGHASVLALDGVASFFLVLVGLLATAAATACLENHGKAIATLPALPAFLAGMMLTVLAGDGITLLVGFELMSIASFTLVVTAYHDGAVRSAGLLYLGMAGLGAVCLVAVVAVLGDADFTVIRAHPPQGWRAVAVLVLVLIGAGSKAGLAPLHIWLPAAHAAAPGPVSALMSGAMTSVALYVLIRVLFDLAGAGQPAWWALPLLLMGAAGAVIGALRANMEDDVKAVLACSTVENIGLIAIGLGLAFAARAADLPSLAGLAFGAALLHIMGHGVFKALLFLAAGAVQYGAGSRLLGRLGGLIHTMPVTALAMMLGAACLAGLPPSVGFAGEWLLLQSVLAAARQGGLGPQILVCVLAAAMALATALAAAAAVRLVGVALLGRPRTPQAAASVEAGLPMRWAMVGLGFVCGLIGLFPSMVLALARPALRQVSGGLMDGRSGVLMVTPLLDAPGYAPLAVMGLIALGMLLIAVLLRLRAGPGLRMGPAWDCGFGAPPPWLPNGDPLTQYGGGSFAQPLRRALGTALLAAHEQVSLREPGDVRPARIGVGLRDPAQAWLFGPLAALRERLSRLADQMQFLTIRQSLSVIFVVLVTFLAVIALLEQT